jgi:hypothetical protein
MLCISQMTKVIASCNVHAHVEDGDIIQMHLLGIARRLILQPL